MRGYSIRALCREAADPETPPARLVALADRLVDLAPSHDLRLTAALLSNPGLPHDLAVSLLYPCPRVDRPAALRYKPGPRLSSEGLFALYVRARIHVRIWARASTPRQDKQLPAVVCRALQGNPAWDLYRLSDPALSRLPGPVRAAIALSYLWPSVSDAWWSDPDVPPW